jgi:hypothetical protein
MALVANDPKAPQELRNLYNSIINNYTSAGNWGEEGAKPVISGFTTITGWKIVGGGIF